MKRFVLIFLLTAMCILGYFEFNLSADEKLFWLNLSL